MISLSGMMSVSQDLPVRGTISTIMRSDCLSCFVLLEVEHSIMCLVQREKLCTFIVLKLRVFDVCESRKVCEKTKVASYIVVDASSKGGLRTR